MQPLRILSFLPLPMAVRAGLPHGGYTAETPDLFQLSQEQRDLLADALSEEEVEVDGESGRLLSVNPLEKARPVVFARAEETFPEALRRELDAELGVRAAMAAKVRAAMETGALLTHNPRALAGHRWRPSDHGALVVLHRRAPGHPAVRAVDAEVVRLNNEDAAEWKRAFLAGEIEATDSYGQRTAVPDQCLGDAEVQARIAELRARPA